MNGIGEAKPKKQGDVVIEWYDDSDEPESISDYFRIDYELQDEEEEW